MQPTIACDEDVFDFQTLLHLGTVSSNISWTWLPIPPEKRAIHT